MVIPKLSLIADINLELRVEILKPHRYLRNFPFGVRIEVNVVIARDKTERHRIVAAVIFVSNDKCLRKVL